MILIISAIRICELKYIGSFITVLFIKPMIDVMLKFYITEILHIVLWFFFIVCLRLVSCVPNVVSFSELSIFDCPFDVLYTGFLFHQISIYIINPLHKLTIIICNTDTAFKLIIRTWMAQ